mmetsp:Transcript_11385/g.16071  ORF Transcript_11385/g.16071 Transcript_11385/m.16071 type:complete len:165 (+) Transcript_11385:16-510(+)
MGRKGESIGRRKGGHGGKGGGDGNTRARTKGGGQKKRSNHAFHTNNTKIIPDSKEAIVSEFTISDENASRDSILCREISSPHNNDMTKNNRHNPLAGLRLRMWDFAQCDPKRCTGARLMRRGIFEAMALRKPFRGIVLSPNGQTSVSPTDMVSPHSVLPVDPLA